MSYAIVLATYLSEVLVWQRSLASLTVCSAHDYRLFAEIQTCIPPGAEYGGGKKPTLKSTAHAYNTAQISDRNNHPASTMMSLSPNYYLWVFGAESRHVVINQVEDKTSVHECQTSLQKAEMGKGGIKYYKMNSTLTSKKCTWKKEERGNH